MRIEIKNITNLKHLINIYNDIMFIYFLILLKILKFNGLTQKIKISNLKEIFGLCHINKKMTKSNLEKEYSGDYLFQKKNFSQIDIINN